MEKASIGNLQHWPKNTRLITCLSCIWLPVWGTGNKCRTSSLRSWRFCGVFLFCGSQSTRKMNQGLNRKRWFSFGAAESIKKKKEKTARALRRLQDKRFGSHLTGVRKCKFYLAHGKDSTSYNYFSLKVKSKCNYNMLKKFLRSKLRAL